MQEKKYFSGKKAGICNISVVVMSNGFSIGFIVGMEVIDRVQKGDRRLREDVKKVGAWFVTVD